MMAWKQSFQGSRTYVATQRCCKPSEIVEQRRSSWRKWLEKTPCGYGAECKNVKDDMEKDGVLPVEDVWEGRQWWRYDGYYQMLDPDLEDKLHLDWYAVPPPEGLYYDDE